VKRQRIVLVVEDEWLVRMEIVDALQEAGWLVIEAASGEEAADILDQGSTPDLLVTDIRLGGAMTGWDLAETCRAARPAIKVIYASANPAIESRFVSGSRFMEKPSRMDELVALSNRLCRGD
jgi:CheY-like chemotaxis protein